MKPFTSSLPALSAAAVALAALTASSSAGAANDPDLEWRTIHTPHFRVHYPKELDPLAARVASLSETVHERLKGPLGYTPSSITEIVLTDNTDSANGSATALPYNTIRLYVTAPEDMSPLSDYDDWFLDLITHEYTHVLHVDNISGLPAILNAVLGKTFVPNQVQPRWIIEGLAVLAETEHTSAGRLRGSLFDMYLRADVLEDNVARLDQISSGAYRWPQGNLWYLYGSKFLGWISDVYGKDTMSAVSADYGGSIVPWGINRAVRRVTGRTYVELYEGFKDHIKRRYAEQIQGVEKRGLREGTRLTNHGRVVFYPRFVPASARSGKGEELIYFRSDYSNRSGLYRFPIGDARTPPRSEELVARTNSPSAAAFLPSGEMLFNSTSIWKNVYGRNDLFLLPRGATSPQGEESVRRRLTTGLRASFPSVSPDGRQVVFTVNSMGTTFLETADVLGDKSLSPRRTLVPSARFEQAYTPSFSPDSRYVAYSVWTAGGYRDIRIVDAKTGSFRQVTRDRAVDTHPEWSPDGRTLYFSSDRSGIANIYAYDVGLRTLKQVTNVRTGAMQPAISADGTTLVYVGYTSEGYDLYTMPIDPARFLNALPAPTDRPDPPKEPAAVPLRRTPYSPLPTLAPRSFLIDVAPGKYGPNAFSINARGSDVVGHHVIAAALVADPDAPAPDVTLDYSYRRLPFDLGTRFFYAVSPRAGYRLNDEDRRYDERTVGITSGISYSLNQDFSSHSFGLSYSVAAFRGDLPVGQNLDPYATRTRDPLSGTIGVTHLGYHYSNVEGSHEVAGPARGFSLGIGVDVAERGTGSDFTLRSFEATVNAYVPMPWPGDHTLALRTAGGISSGTFPSGTYYVGGYDLDRFTLIDTITTGVFDGAFVLRGYPPGSYIGRQYLLQNIEYRVPLLKPDRGYSTLPLYLQRIDGNLFLDYGGAFNNLDLDKIKLFNDGYLIDSPNLHAAIGGEIWFGVTLGYTIYTQLRLGYAYGFSADALENGQLYFVASSAF